MLSSRPYRDADMPRLQVELARWINEAGGCGYYHVGDLPHRVYALLRGKQPVGTLVHVWEEEANIVGIAINGLYNTAFHVFTSPAYRGTEHELAMLAAAYATTSQHMEALGEAAQWVVTDVYACDAIRIELLTQLGFAHYRLWDHITMRSLGDPIPEPQLPTGFSIRSASIVDHAQLSVLHNNAFADDWTAAQYRDEVMAKPGYHPENALVVVAPDEQLVAFTIIWFDALNRVGLFEPVGTHHDFQRRGLARGLMLHGLGKMRRQGMATASVAHAADNQAARELYQSLGFAKRYETLGYHKAVA